jgi:hypothetical protein
MGKNGTKNIHTKLDDCTAATYDSASSGCLIFHFALEPGISDPALATRLSMLDR